MDTATITTELAPVTLAGSEFTVRECVFTWTDRDGKTRTGSEVFLTGARGAEYFLRGFLNGDNGLRQVISCKSGAPLRKHGNEIRVIRIGDILEQAPARPVRVAR